MKKRSIAACMMVMVTLMAAGCSGGSSTGGGTTGGAAEPSRQTGEAAADQESEKEETGQKDKEPHQITFVLKSLGSNYWVQLKAGAVDKAAELGVNLEVLAPSSDNATEDQIRMLEDQVVSGADLVLVAPSNSGAQMATFDKVVDAGIPLICVDTNAKDYEKKTAFIGSSNEEVGKQAGEYLAEKVTDKSGAVIILRGQLGDETADTRSRGCT